VADEVYLEMIGEQGYESREDDNLGVALFALVDSPVQSVKAAFPTC